MIGSKKGWVVDMFLMGIFALAMAITIICVVFFWSKSIDMFNQTHFVSDNTLNQYKANEQKFITAFDVGFLFIFITLNISTLILAFTVKSHPIFYIIFFLILFAMSFVNLYLEGVYFAIVSTSQFAPIAMQFPIINYCMDYLGFIIAIFSLIIAGVSYGKS